ncbi:hypothetical protein ACHAQJ_000944 [Trichoderma viride]
MSSSEMRRNLMKSQKGLTRLKGCCKNVILIRENISLASAQIQKHLLSKARPRMGGILLARLQEDHHSQLIRLKLKGLWKT